MMKIALGRTGLEVTKTAFGALPVQRVDFDTARSILRRAYEAGINFFDTARAYSDSEEKIGYSLADVRERIVIASKSHAGDRKGVLEHIDISLATMKTDYIDILQLHNPKQLPDPNDPQSSYAGLVEAKAQGKIRHIGITAHALPNAIAAVESGLYDTVQYPVSVISSEAELALADLCRDKNVGLIGMKAVCGGLLSNIPAAFAFLWAIPNVVPIWGIQRMSELEEFIALDAAPPALDEAMKASIAADRAELSADFCRACGYCLPCPADIPIPMAARMKYLIRRAPSAGFLGEQWQQKMARIDNCIECNQCHKRCPYDLDTPKLLKKMYADYKTFLS